MLEVRNFSFDNNDFSYADIPSSFGSNPEDIKNNYKEINYISFDGLGIDLIDVNKKFYDGEYAGYISTNCSDENCGGVYLCDLYFRIPEKFPEGITLLFYGQCCKEIWIQYSYNAEELYQYTIEVNDSIVYIPIEPFGISQGEVVCAASVRICVQKTTLPHQLLKLQSVIIGKVNVLKKFKSSSLLEEINVLSDDLPINSFECSAILKQNINFRKDDPMNVYKVFSVITHPILQ